MVIFFWIVIVLFLIIGISQFANGQGAMGFACICMAGIMCTYFPVRTSVIESSRKTRMTDPESLSNKKYVVATDSYVKLSESESDSAASWVALVIWLIPCAILSLVLSVVAGTLMGIVKMFQQQ